MGAKLAEVAALGNGGQFETLRVTSTTGHMGVCELLPA
jgi:hypothetical protein